MAFKNQSWLTTWGNLNRFPENEEVISVAAYGEQRPVTSNLTPFGQDANRRIDIRFVMWVPKNGKALADFKDAQKKIGAAQ